MQRESTLTVHTPWPYRAQLVVTVCQKRTCLLVFCVKLSSSKKTNFSLTTWLDSSRIRYLNIYQSKKIHDLLFSTHRIFDCGNALVQYPFIICTHNHILQNIGSFCSSWENNNFCTCYTFIYFIHVCKKVCLLRYKYKYIHSYPWNPIYVNLAHMATFAQIFRPHEKVATILLWTTVELLPALLRVHFFLPVCALTQTIWAYLTSRHCPRPWKLRTKPIISLTRPNPKASPVKPFLPFALFFLFLTLPVFQLAMHLISALVITLCILTRVRVKVKFPRAFSCSASHQPSSPTAMTTSTTSMSRSVCLTPRSPSCPAARWAGGPRGWAGWRGCRRAGGGGWGRGRSLPRGGGGWRWQTHSRLQFRWHLNQFLGKPLQEEI